MRSFLIFSEYELAFLGKIIKNLHPNAKSIGYFRITFLLMTFLEKTKRFFEPIQIMPIAFFWNAIQ